MKNRVAIFCLFSLIVGSGAMAHDSTDKFEYPGSNCVSSGTNQANGYYSYGRVKNTQTSSKSYFCPLVADEHGVKTYDVFAQVYDRHPSINPTCSYYHFSSTSKSGGHYYRSMKRYGGSNNEIVTFRADVGNVSGAWYMSYDYILCTLPPKYGSSSSELISVGINEFPIM